MVENELVEDELKLAQNTVMKQLLCFKEMEGDGLILDVFLVQHNFVGCKDSFQLFSSYYDLMMLIIDLVLTELAGFFYVHCSNKTNDGYVYMKYCVL